MDFLTTALYALDPAGTEQLSGALLTRFDPSDTASRAKVIFVTSEQLKAGDNIQPSGFRMDENGVLMSDTQARREMNQDLVNYVNSEVSDQPAAPPPSLIDVVLCGATYGADIVVNFDAMTENRELEPIVIPMSSLKVSSSSFNIYAPYKNAEGKFRTLSLINIETDENIPFVMAIPEGACDKFQRLMEFMVPMTSVDIQGYTLFRVDAKFAPFYTFTGEAFCNYLAYNVAYCNIGLKVINEFLAETKFVSAAKEEDEYTRQPKTPLHNVSIECTCKDPCTHAVLECIGDMEKLKALVKNEEAYITFIWLQNIFKAGDQFEGDGVEDRWAAACASLQRECRLQRLHYAAELLAQRYYICQIGRIEDCLGQVLRGGGVNGCAIKRVTG